MVETCLATGEVGAVISYEKRPLFDHWRQFEDILPREYNCKLEAGYASTKLFRTRKVVRWLPLPIM